MTKDGWTRITDHKDFVGSVKTILAVETHVLREAVLWRVVVPLLGFPVGVCVILIALDAIGVIRPMRTASLTVVGGIVISAVVTSAISAGFGWLYKSS